MNKVDVSDLLKFRQRGVANGTATRTREERAPVFVNQSWERGPGDLEINLEQRIILSPFAARRPNEMPGKLLQEYENRYGEPK